MLYLFRVFYTPHLQTQLLLKTGEIKCLTITKTRPVVDRIVIVPHNCHLLKNGCLKYDHRVMYKKYTTSLPFYGMWGSRKTHLEMAQPTKRKVNAGLFNVYFRLFITVNSKLLFFFVGWAISRCLSTTPHPIKGQGGSILLVH